MKLNYPKKEKLKSHITITSLFTEGQSVSKFPLRLVYVPVDPSQQKEKIKMGVSVSKRNFKKAVDRNYFKRVLRETYRLNQDLLHSHVERPYAIMFFYQTKDRLTFNEINEKTIQLFHKFILAIANDSKES